MRTLVCLLLLFLISKHGYGQIDIEKPGDSVQYLLNSNFDNSTSWNLSKQSGSAANKFNYSGIDNNGIAVIYQFPSAGGWFDMTIPLSDTILPVTPFVFYIFSSSSVSDNLEIKFTDKDGSVFRRVVPLNNFTGGWNHVVIYLDNTDYAWGGDNKFDTFAKFSIAASGSGIDTIWLDEIGIGKTGLKSSFLSVYDRDSTLSGIGFAQRRDAEVENEDLLVLKYLEVIQDISSPLSDLLPSQEDDQAQTFNNCLSAMAFITKNEKNRAEKILDYYSNATDINNTDIGLQNFYCNGEARGFYQWVSLNSRLAPPGAVDRWIGDMAWLLITCKYYQKTYDSDKYDTLVTIIRDLLISYYKDSGDGGYIQSGWRHGDSYLHEPAGHHEGNIDCYVALKLCGENFYAQKIKNWLEHELNNQKNLPLDLYTWRVLAFGSDYASLLNIPEYNYSYRKVMDVNGIPTMGFYNSPDLATDNFWNDGTGHIACAFQAFGDKERGYFYANQLDNVIIERIFGTDTTHAIPYTLNKTGGYSWVDTTKGFISPAAWYILAKNSINPFMSENFKDTILSTPNTSEGLYTIPPYPNPFSEGITTELHLPSPSTIKIEIYDAMGRKIKLFRINDLPRANYSISWDGTDNMGESMSRGIYFMRISAMGKYLTSYKIIKI